MNGGRTFFIAAFLAWATGLALADDELSRIWRAPGKSVRERADAVNRAFTNGTPVSVVVAALGTNYTRCMSSARVWLGPGPEPPNTLWLSYRFEDGEVTIHTSAVLGRDLDVLTGKFSSAGYSLPVQPSAEATNPIRTGQSDGAADWGQPTESLKPDPKGQRLIRVSFRGEHGTFRFRVNQRPIEKLRNVDFTNVMTKLQLAYGDIVVWEDLRDQAGKELTHPEDISTWWFKHLHDVRASFYTIPSDTFSDFFGGSIYHWKAPPDKPRPLLDAQFLVDGAALGQGARGFQAMVAAIEKRRSGPVIIFAPRIKNEGQASPWIALGQLSAWAQEAGAGPRFEKIVTSRYVEFEDFARLGDDE